MVGVVTVANADYAAIAYSPKTGKWGYAFGSYSLGTVQRNALNRCGAFDAQIAVWVENGWCALAQDANGHYGWGWSTCCLANAQATALQNASSNAHIVCWTYSGD